MSPQVIGSVLNSIQSVNVNALFAIYRSMDGGMEEDEYASDPITQQRRQVS